VKKKSILLTGALGLLLLLAACAGQRGYRLPAAHPDISEFSQRREFCTKCHGFKREPIDFERYNHTPLFTDSHRLVAYEDDRICALCHSIGFCNDCHATRVELKPSLRNQTENYRRMQHRGDYLARHRIDARIDPTSCFRCHGNPRSSQTCQPCHG
jgi:hypothetical protein